MLIDDCLKRKVIFFTGKGGVGKTTLAWATALACRQRGLKVTVAGWNPFDHEDAHFPGQGLDIGWVPLETIACFKEYALRILKFETVYNVAFDNHVLKTFLKAAPGLSETVVSGKIWDLYEKNEQDLLIVDLPSSGHAFSFFQSPMGVKKIFAVGFVNKEAGKIIEMFHAPTTRVDFVTLPEELPIVETKELKQKLDGIGPFSYGYLFVNQTTPNFPIGSLDAAIPADVRACAERHEARLKIEKEALTYAEDLAMEKVFIPRFPTDSIAETLKRVASQLSEGNAA